MSRIKVKDMTPQQQAEHALRRRLFKERRIGSIDRVSEVTYICQEEKEHIFGVKFVDGQAAVFGVTVYSRSYRICRI